VSRATVVVSAVLGAPALALLGVAMGLVGRFASVPSDAVVRRPGLGRWPGGGGAWHGVALWPAAATLAVAASPPDGAGWSPAVAARAAVTVAAAAALAAVVTRWAGTRPGVVDDAARSMALVLSVAVAAGAVLTATVPGGDAAGDGFLAAMTAHGWAPATEEQLWSVPGAGAAAVALVVLGAVWPAVTVTPWRARVVAAVGEPEWLMRTGHDPRSIAAQLAGLAAGLGATASVLAGRGGGPVAPAALMLAAQGVAVASVGGPGSIPGALAAALVLSLIGALGDELRPQLGTVAVVAIAAVVMAVRCRDRLRSGAIVEPVR